jgi:hypothetical protein
MPIVGRADADTVSGGTGVICESAQSWLSPSGLETRIEGATGRWRRKPSIPTAFGTRWLELRRPASMHHTTPDYCCHAVAAIDAVFEELQGRVKKRQIVSLRALAGNETGPA